jgi:predicted transcriptional regulator
MSQKNFTCRVDEELKNSFLLAAKSNDRSASVLVRDFMRDYVKCTLGFPQEKQPSSSKPSMGKE